MIHRTTGQATASLSCLPLTPNEEERQGVGFLVARPRAFRSHPIQQTGFNNNPQANRSDPSARLLGATSNLKHALPATPGSTPSTSAHEGLRDQKPTR